MRAAILGIVLLTIGAAAEPCRSGLKPNQRPGPYSSLVAVGTQRGQPHCFVCEAADRPVVIVFARTLNDPVGKLVKKIDTALGTHKQAELRAWATFLTDDQPTLDPLVVQWAQKHALRDLPVGIFEDTVGPPAYLLTREADVTVLLAVKQRVIANFAYRAGELDDAAIDAVMEAVPRLVANPK